MLTYIITNLFILTCDDDVTIVYPRNCLSRISTYFENIPSITSSIYLEFPSKVVSTFLDIVVFPEVEVVSHDNNFWLEILRLADLLEIKKKYQENLLMVITKIFPSPHNYLYPPPVEKQLHDLQVMLTH